MIISKKISEIIMLANCGKFAEAEQSLQVIFSENNKKNVEDEHLGKLVNHLFDRYGIRGDKGDKSLRMGTPPPITVHKTIVDTSLRFNSDSIYIVTPTFNSAETLEETIKSVVEQKGNFDLYYHVQDGGSSDNTIEIVKKWQTIVKNGEINCNKIVFTFTSVTDKGMYDALYKGFENILPLQDVWMGWINSDDTLMPDVLQFLVDTSRTFGDDVSWVTGMQAVMMPDGSIRMHDLNFSTNLISYGLCDGENWFFLQQEGTFWRKKLWDKVDLESNFRHFRFAGDWSLWYSFAKHGATLFQARMPLGLFHSRPGQLSQLHFSDYLQEIEEVVSMKDRKKLLEVITDEYFQIHRLERFHNYEAIVMSSVMIQFIGPKSCFPTIHPVAQLN